jgi:hypothetical protein
MANLNQLIPKDILELYEVHSFRHAAEILATAYPTELRELLEALRSFRLTTKDILKGGGNESEIPKKFPDCCHPRSGLRHTSVVI